MIAPTHLLFSKRKKLGELYDIWRVENKVYDCPSSVIGFLSENGLLNVEKCIEFLDESSRSKQVT